MASVAHILLLLSIVAVKNVWALNVALGSAPYSVTDDYPNNSSLSFTRYYNPLSSSFRSSLGVGWHHQYNVFLTKDGRDLIVFHNNGQRIIFRPDPNSDKPPGTLFDNDLNPSSITYPIDQWRYPGLANYRQRPGPVVYKADRISNGQVIKTSLGHIWLSSDGWQRLFRGSFLIAMRHPDGALLELRYLNQQLIRVSNENQEHLDFTYDQNQLSGVTFPSSDTLQFFYDSDDRLVNTRLNDTQVSHYHYAPSNYFLRSDQDTLVCPPGYVPAPSASQAGADDEGELTNPIQPTSSGSELPTQQVPVTELAATVCDTQQSPLSEHFFVQSNIPNAIQLDARPNSCRSYFVEFYGTDRGTQIELGFSQLDRYANTLSTVRSFPIVDFYHDGIAQIIISRDLSSPTYNNANNPDALFDRLLQDGHNIEDRLLGPLSENGSITVNELGQSTTLTSDQIDQLYLELVIQQGMASASHIDQILRAKEDLFERWRINLRIIEIP